MENIFCLILIGIMVLILIILFVKEIKKEDLEDKARNYDLNEMKKRLEFYKQLDYLPKDNDEYEVGSWEKEVREDIKPIIKIVEHYKPNKKINVLVGDYNKSSVSNTVSVLESMGIDVKIAKSGIEIIKRILQREKYDLIISNNIYDRGYCDGPQTLEKLRELENFNTPVIVLTVSSGQRNKFIDDYGFDEYMTKLLTQEQVIETFPKLLDGLEFNKEQEKKQ